MRLVHWVWLASLALFITGFTMSVRSMNRSSSIIPGDTAVVKQVMRGLVIPASTTLFNSVGTIITEAGIDERAPKTPEEWDIVTGAAAMLVEAGSILTTPNRLKDRGEWVTRVQALVDAAQVSLKAAEAKDPEELFNSGEALTLACDNCHEEYQLEDAF